MQNDCKKNTTINNCFQVKSSQGRSMQSFEHKHYFYPQIGCALIDSIDSMCNIINDCIEINSSIC